MFTKFVRRLACMAVLMLTLVVSALPVSAQNRTHTVRPGETLVIIANYYGTNWQAIATANNIVNPNVIYVGQVLVIPPSNILANPPTRPYMVVRGDTLTTIAQKYGVTVEAIVAVNGITTGSTLYAGQTLNIPYGVVTPSPSPNTGYGVYYFVQPGDTMFRISAYYGINVYRIAEANGILNLNRIYAGQMLYIPSY